MDQIEGDYTWKKIATGHRVGTRQELLFWRVATHGGASKEYFYSPEDYEAFSGIPMSEFQEQADAWKQQYAAAEQEFNDANTNINSALMYNDGQSYASFFPTDQPA